MPNIRFIATDIVHQAITRRTAPEFLFAQHAAYRALAPEDQAFVQAMVLRSFRHLGQLQHVLQERMTKPLPPSKQWVQHALLVGVAQLLCLQTPAHAAIYETVQAVKESKFKALFGMVNAVLNRVSREKPMLPDARYNWPEWLWQALQAKYTPAQLQVMAQAAAQVPGYDINTSLAPLTDEEKSVPQAIVQAHRFLPTHLRVAEGAPIAAVLAHYPGWFVQDIAASFPVQMLGDIAQKHVLEIGAAPGGKTMQLLAKGAIVTALDRSKKRMLRLQENLAARGLEAKCVVADALDYQPEQAPDIVLLDAPCSAIGTWRKHPEVVHLLDEKAIADLQAVQRALIAQSLTWLKPGGWLLYCVCSIHPEEGEAQAAWALETQNVRVVPASEAGILPDALQIKARLTTDMGMQAAQGGMDGFFGVLFEKL